MGTIEEMVEDSVAEGGIADDIVPVLNGDLAGEQRATAGIAVVEDFEEVVPSRPCGAEAPGARTASPARAGEPATAAGPGTGRPPAQRRPVPPATATTSPPQPRGARSRSPCCWQCRATWPSRGGCARARLQAHQFSNLPHGQPFLRHPLPPRLRGPRRGWTKAPLQQVLSAATRSLQGDRHPSESVIGLNRNP